MTAAPSYENSVRVGCARVSTRAQEYQAQLDALAVAHCREIIVGTASTRGDRPKLREALGQLQAGDTLVICKPDRVARSMKKLLVLLEDQLHARGINLHILTGICAGIHRPDGAAIAGKMLFMVAVMAAEMARDLIRERTLDGLPPPRPRAGVAAALPLSMKTSWLSPAPGSPAASRSPPSPATSRSAGPRCTGRCSRTSAIPYGPPWSRPGKARDPPKPRPAAKEVRGRCTRIAPQASATRPRPAIDRREMQQLRLSQRGVTAGVTLRAWTRPRRSGDRPGRRIILTRVNIIDIYLCMSTSTSLDPARSTTAPVVVVGAGQSGLAAARAAQAGHAGGDPGGT